MFHLIKKGIVIETILVGLFVGLALMQGGNNLRIMGEMTGVEIFYALADEADLIQGKAFSLVGGVESEYIERASIADRTGRILKEYKKEL
jgi:hypothetical protein